MTITYRTRQFPKDVLITSVHCAICHRFVTTGQYTIAPASSIYAGKPICAACIDMVPTERFSSRAGPSERKILEPEQTKGTEGPPSRIARYTQTTAGNWHLDILDSSPD